MSALSVLQIPSRCDLNTYVAESAAALGRIGVRLASDDFCVDGFAGVCGSLDLESPADIVHLHWPEKLAALHGVEGAIALLRRMSFEGSRIVWTMHNEAPHDPISRQLYDEVINLADAIHFFSNRQRVAVGRPDIASIVLPHPAFSLPKLGIDRGRSDERRHAGCVGRIRGYKGFTSFARNWVDCAPQGWRLTVAGLAAPDEVEALKLLSNTRDVTISTEFLDFAEMIDLVASLDVVVLPYDRIWSSGMLVLAAQLGTPVICPDPAMLDADACSSYPLNIVPGSDVCAAIRILQRGVYRPPTPPTMTTFDDLAAALVNLYEGLIE